MFEQTTHRVLGLINKTVLPLYPSTCRVAQPPCVKLQSMAIASEPIQLLTQAVCFVLSP